MKVTWVNQAFGDYRIPVYAELDRMLGGQLHVIYSAVRTQSRVQKKIESLLGERAVGLAGERTVLRLGRFDGGFSNRNIEIPYQPGLTKAIAATRPDVVIGEGFAKWTAAGLYHKLRHGTPLVVSYQRTHHTERRSQWYRRAYRRMALRYVDGVCCNGRLSAEYVRWLGMPANRIVTGANAADNEVMASRCAATTAEEIAELKAKHAVNGTTFLYVGRLIKLKGVDHLLRGWAKACAGRGFQEATLLIIGDGPERPHLATLVEELGLQNVRMLGHLDYDSLAPYYACADVFVIPTLEDNWSLVVPESMACGLPILSSIYNGCWPELVHDQVNGFTFDPFDTAALAGLIRFFMDNPEQILLMGEASKRIVGDFRPVNAARAFYTACEMAMSRQGRLEQCL